jgi:hypothetical protein
MYSGQVHKHTVYCVGDNTESNFQESQSSTSPAPHILYLPSRTEFPDVSGSLVSSFTILTTQEYPDLFPQCELLQRKMMALKLLLQIG